jgi:pantoate--beta-alanine ligase
MSDLEVIETVFAMQAWSEQQRRAGRTVGCVPTMGYLHEGHMSLIKECAGRADRVVMTLFVNPTQFAPHEDLDKYPRDFDGDCQKARQAGAHAVFYPSVREMYPDGFQTYVTVEEVSRDMEGEFRPVHFRGVATVCAKLFNAVRPSLAVFGEKDFQQLKVVQRMARDLNLGIEVLGMPTVREPDGLAMSSRNKYLDPDERKRALSISRALFAARDAVKAGEQNVKALCARAEQTIKQAGLEIDYVEIRDADTLLPIAKAKPPARMLIAASVKSARLIDNLEIC